MNSSTRVRFNLKLLNDLIQKHDIKITEEYTKLTRDSVIKFICECGSEGSGAFRCIYKRDSFECKKCIFKNNVKNIQGNIDTVNDEKKIKQIEHELLQRKLRREITNMIKYGAKSIVESKMFKEKTQKNIKSIREKINKNNIEKFGCTNPLQNPEIKEKSKITLMKKYGVESALQSDVIKKKRILNNIKKYGVEYPMQLQSVKDKIIENNLKKYGVEYPIQTLEVQSKSEACAKRFKSYTTPNGEIRRVQGYESFALDELLKIYKEEDIITARKYIPKFKYFLDDKYKYYFPDIFIKSMNKIIEVKSQWTYGIKKSNIQLKAQAVKNEGCDYEIWIFDSKRNKIIKTE
jgi:hypothetical protein